MAEKEYVINGDILVCTDGAKSQTVEVTSQNSVYICGALAATEKDRMAGNFNCLKVGAAAGFIGMIGGAIAGAVVGAATGAALGGKIGSIFGPVGKVIGGVFGGAVGGIVGVFVGGIAGDVVGHLLANAIPGVCRGLTCLAEWSKVHPACEISGNHALMPDAKMNCLLGGVITIVKLNFRLATDYAFLSYFAYERNKPDANDNKPFEPYNTYLDKEKDKELLDELQSDKLPDYTRVTELSEVGLEEGDLEDKKSGFYAQVYKDSNGKYVLVYRGTSNGHDKNREIIPGFSKDWIDDDAKQGIGLGSDQYEQAIKTAQKMKVVVGKENMTITGHSLGGGLAQAAGAAVGCETYAYNPAGVHPNTINNKEYKVNDPDFSKVHIIYAKIDFLNFFNNNSIIFPNTDGERILIDTDAPVDSLGDLLHKGHDLPYLIKALKKGVKTTNNSVVAKDA